jgi:hypothetical protein
MLDYYDGRDSNKELVVTFEDCRFHVRLFALCNSCNLLFSAFLSDSFFALRTISTSEWGLRLHL